MANHPTDKVRPVIFLGAPGTSWLYFDEDNQQVEMSTVKLEDLSLSDFKRIHQFWKRVHNLKLKSGGVGGEK